MQPVLRTGIDVRERDWTSPLLMGLGLAVPLIALIGWGIDRRLLYDFAIVAYPFAPFAALAYALLGLAQVLAEVDRRRLATVVVLAPLLFGGVSLTRYALGGTSAWPAAAQPTIFGALALTATALATLIAIYGGRRLEILIFWLGAIVLGLGWLSISLLLFGLAPATQEQPLRIISSLPGAIAMIAQACFAFGFRSRADPGSLFGRKNPSGNAITLALPTLLILPAGLLPLEQALASHLMTPFTAYVVALGAVLLISVLLIGVGTVRIARAHNALVESEGRLEHALESYRIGLFDWQLEGDRLRWSPGAEERIGVAHGALADLKSWMALVEPADAQKVMDSVAGAAAGKFDHYGFRYRIRSADGDWRVIDGAARCFYDKRGELIRVSGVNIDITDQVQREAEIARREAQWLSMLRTVPDAMIVFDHQGIVKSFSDAAERVFGYAVDEVLGRNAMMLLPDADARVVMAQLAVGIVPGKMLPTAGERVFTGQRKDGTQFPAEYSYGEAMMDGVPSFTVFVRDISDRRAAERRFQALQIDYAHSARLNAVGELASGLAHELNQPLAAAANFLGTAELLLEDMEGGEVISEMIASADAQMIRAGEIIRRLRDFIAKTDADIRVEPLTETLQEAVALALVGARQQQIEVDYRLDPEAGLILADRIQIQQVVVNLVRNAAQALRLMPPERRRIVIAARPIDQEMLEVSITDQGRGLPPEILEQLFAPFRSTKSGEGLGIGLSICRRIIEAHGGTLGAENLAEGGARMSFTLPRVVEDQGTEVSCVTSMS